MLSVLMKVKCEIRCIIDDKEYEYKDGASAYSDLKNAYSIISITTRDNRIILELEHCSNTSNWEEEYKEQFGNEPSFF